MHNVFIKTPTGTKKCKVIEFIANEKYNKATLKVKGLVESQNVTTNIEIADLDRFMIHLEVSSKHGYYKLLKAVEDEDNKSNDGTFSKESREGAV